MKMIKILTEIPDDLYYEYKNCTEKEKDEIMENGAEADRMVLNAIPVEDLNSELEKLKEENEKLKLTHTKIIERIREYSFKQWEKINDNVNDLTNHYHVDDFKRDMAEASIDIVEKTVKEIMDPNYIIKEDPILFTRCKYFDELGIEKYFTNFYDYDDRVEEWRKEREEYGFDSRETWCLDSILIEWIYSRFRRYKEVCNVDLDWRGPEDCRCFHFKEDDEEKILTQREAIDLILKYCEKYIKDEFVYQKNKYSELFNSNFWILFGELLPAMWW